VLKVGFSEISITPAPGLRMAGMLNPPKAEGAYFPLYARTVVFDDGVQQAAVVSLDLLVLLPSTVAEFRQAVTAGTRLAPTDVMITCTHTHRAPYTAALMDEDPDFAYLDFVCAQMVKGMAEAQAALRPARLKAGAVEAPGWTFNRRQVYRTALGEQVGTQGPEWIEPFLRREGPEDNQLQVLLAEDLDGKILGGLVNFACHTTLMGAEPFYSADYPGPLMDQLKQRYGGVFAFIQGAAGNLWAIDMSHEINPMDRMGPDYTVKMATALAEKAGEAIAAGKYIQGERVRMARRVLGIPQRRSTPEQIELAKWYLRQDPKTINLKEFSQRIYPHAYTFYSGNWDDEVVQTWFAREALGMWEWQRRSATRELVEEVEIQALAVGDAAIAGYPAEYFTEFGLMTKAGSPFTATLVSELANGWHGYVPTQAAFAHGGYETRFAYQSRLAPEAGDRMCAAALDLLKQLTRPEAGGLTRPEAGGLTRPEAGGLKDEG
jgi:neutral ceramidase